MATWEWSGDRTLVRRFEDDDLITANRKALALAARMREVPGIADVIPGARSVCVVLAPGTPPDPALTDALESEPALGVPQSTSHEIHVIYDGVDLPDLIDRLGISRAEILQIHSAAEYTVAFTGFSPGFPYLLGLPARLHVPRLATPRRKVPAGSVAIAGLYTGVYPRATPGGWRLIGRTDFELFDPNGDPPARLQPGDHVRFIPI